MKKFYTHKVIINKAQNLKRIDQALAKLVTECNRSQIKILINKGNIKNEKEVINNASFKVKTGEKYYVNIPEFNQIKYKPENIPLNIKFEDENILVVDKCFGMVTHPAPGNQIGTLVHALLEHTKNNLSSTNKNRPGIVHRLDKDTSGLIVVAKNNFSHEELSKQFKNHSITRKYHAIVWGIPNNQTIEGYIERNKVNRKKMSLNKNNNGKFSKTIISLKRSFKICSLIECLLKTGRTHQVRLHLTSINSPIIGDKLYGKNKISKFSKNKENIDQFYLLSKFQRQALHAYCLGFLHPISKKYIEFQSEFPKDMKNLLDLLVKY